MRDDVQYYRDLYNLERVEALKGPNAMIFGRGGGGGVVNRVTKEARLPAAPRGRRCRAEAYGNKRFAADFDQPLNDTVAVRLNGMYENSDSFRDSVDLERYGVNPTLTIAAGQQHARSRSATSTSTTARRRPRHHLVPGAPGGRARSPPSTAIRTTATCAPTWTSARRASSIRRAS